MNQPLRLAKLAKLALRGLPKLPNETQEIQEIDCEGCFLGVLSTPPVFPVYLSPIWARAT